MADRVGQQLGNYRLIRMLGEGSFAEVYLGEHIYLNTQAAIKVLHTQLASDDTEKFLIEARTIAHLIHPNIVRVLEFGVEGNTPFLVMDYAPKGTLRQRHPKGVLLPIGTIVSYVKQVADALQYAHDKKLIHRDIKPENMLLGRRGEILLSDFGIAMVAQSSRYQSTQDMAGTMAYMAPEQIQGKPRPASDQYSLGIVVYEWVSGDRPFHGSFTEIVGQHLSVLPPPLCSRVPTILPNVEQVVMTALTKEPKQRFVSMRAFATALEQASQSDVPTFIKPPTPAVQQPRMGTPPSQSPLPTVATIPSGGQQDPRQISRLERLTRLPQPKKSPNFGLIIGTLFLLAALIGGGVFFFTRNNPHTGSGNNPSPTGSRGTTPQITKTIVSPNNLITPGTLTIGSDTTYPPQEFIDTTTGNAAGFDIDLIKAIAARIGLQAKIVTASFDTLINSLVSKRFDVVMSAVFITPERQSMVDFVPYFNAGESLLVQKGNPHNIKSTADLCGLSVGVQTGTIEQSDLNTANMACKNGGKAAINLTVL